MGVQSAGPGADAGGSRGNRSRSLTVYLVLFMVVSVLASGAGLAGLAWANHLNGRPLAVTLAGLAVFLVAALVFYLRTARLLGEAAEHPYGDTADETIGGKVPELIPAGRPDQAKHRQHQAERLESLGQMAGSVAREVDNLLATVINDADIVAQETAGRSAHAHVEKIRVAAQRAARITQQLLIVGRETAPPEALQLNAVLADMDDLLAATLGEGIDIDIDAATDTPAIRADRRQIEQAILNLASNARDAMPHDGTLTIGTCPAGPSERHARPAPGGRPGHYAELIVTDTGTGMSADFAAHIFEPFFTTKPAGQGNGLGLTTVHSIVTGAGGSISVFSEVGTGTTVRLLFPATGKAAPARPATDITRTRGSR